MCALSYTVPFDAGGGGGGVPYLPLPFVDDTVAAGEEDKVAEEDFGAAATDVDDYDAEGSAESDYYIDEGERAVGGQEQMVTSVMI